MTETQRHQEKFSFIRDRIDCGWFHLAAILDDGTCIAHGNNEAQQCDISHWNDIVKIQCGPLRTVGLRKDGTVLSTKGDVFTGGRIPGEGIEKFSDVIDIACGTFHTVGLRKDGTVIACGFNDDGQCNVESWQNVKKIYAASNHTIALCDDGSLLCCGGRDGGALHLNGLTNVKELYCGVNDTIIVTSDNKVYRTDYHNEQPILLDIKGDEVAYVTFSVNHYLILKADGTVLPFGSNDDGQHNVYDWHGVLDISCSKTASLGLSKDMMWTSQEGEFHSVSSKGKAINIFGGNNVSALVSVDGSVFENGTGYDKTWKLFDYIPSKDEDIPVEQMRPVSVDRTLGDSSKAGIAWDYKQKYGYLKKRVAGGITHTIGIMYDGTARACGKHPPQCAVEDWKDLREVVCGLTSTIGLKNDGSVYFTGSMAINTEDLVLCCDGTPFSKWPKNVKTIEVNLSGKTTVVGLLDDGHCVAYGYNEFGQCNVKSWCDITEVLVVNNITLGVRKDGTVVTCGEDQNVKNELATWKDIEHIYRSVATTDFIGIKYDGTVISTIRDEAYDFSTWTDIIDIVDGHDWIFGLRSDGKVYVTGRAPIELFNLVNSLNNVVTIGALSSVFVFSTADNKMIVGSEDKGQVSHQTVRGTIVAFNRGFGQTINVFSDGAVIAAITFAQVDAGQDQTDSWKVIAPNDVSIKASVNSNASQTIVTSNMTAYDLHVKYSVLKDKISWGNCFIACVLSSNEVAAVGNNAQGQCDDVDDWENIHSIACGNDFTFGLKYDGSVCIAGGEWDSSAYGLEPKYWPYRIKKIACGNKHVVGLTVDGKVYAYGNNNYGQCEVVLWDNIRDIYCSKDVTIGITNGNKLVVCGRYSHVNNSDFCHWNDIQFIQGNDEIVVGIKTDGTAISTTGDVSHWDNIMDVTLSRSSSIAYGLRTDGTVVTNDVKVSSLISRWENVVSVFGADWSKDTGYMVSCINAKGKMLTATELEGNQRDPDCKGVFGVSALLGSLVVRADGNMFAIASERVAGIGNLYNIAETIVEAFGTDHYLFSSIDQYKPLDVALISRNPDINYDRLPYYPITGANYTTGETSSNQNTSSTKSDGNVNADRIAELEKKKKHYLTWAIIWVILWWPVSIYFFYKYSQVSKELDSLK